jgi:hypothetical protein
MELSQMSTTVSNNGLALCALGTSIECHVSRMLTTTTTGQMTLDGLHDHSFPNDQSPKPDHAG